MSGKLVRYDAMCRAIAEAHKVDEVKDIRDKALALEAYARQALNTDAEREACEIRLRAERKAGQLLAKPGNKAKGGAEKGVGRAGKKNDVVRHDSIKTLDDLGVSRDQSSKWQKLGAMPEEDFELAIGTKTSKPSTNGILRAAAPRERVVVSKDALWLWGRLRDFGSEEWLAKSPAEVMSTMTPEMMDDVHQLAPRFAAWLKQIGVLNDKRGKPTR